MRKKTPGCIIQRKVGGKKKADVDKVNGSTVNVAHEHQHLRAYTVHASMHHADCIWICKCAWVCKRGSKGCLRIYVVDGNQRTPIRILAAISSRSPLPNTLCNQVLTVMRKCQQDSTGVNQLSLDCGTIWMNHFTIGTACPLKVILPAASQLSVM